MTYLTSALQAFFTDYVHIQRNLTPNTIASYRDTWRPPDQTHLHDHPDHRRPRSRLEDIDRDHRHRLPRPPPPRERANTPATRNARLGGIRVPPRTQPCPTTPRPPKPSAAS